MKVVIKSILHIFVGLSVLYFTLLTKFVGFEHVAMRISRIPYRLGIKVRYQFYRKHLKSVGSNVTFSYGSLVTNVKTVIGSNVRFGPYNSIGLANIGNDIITAQYVHVISGSKQHSFSNRDIPICKQHGVIQCVELEGDNWIGANVVVMANVGNGAILGSGSVVVNDIPAMSVSAGNPCKKLKDRP